MKNSYNDKVKNEFLASDDQNLVTNRDTATGGALLNYETKTENNSILSKFDSQCDSRNSMKNKGDDFE